VTIMILRWLSGRLEFYGTKHLIRRKKETTPFMPNMESIPPVHENAYNMPNISPPQLTPRDRHQDDWVPPTSNWNGQYLNLGENDGSNNKNYWADEDEDEDLEKNEDIITDDIVDSSVTLLSSIASDE
jgi:hypothetical protein